MNLQQKISQHFNQLPTRSQLQAHINKLIRESSNEQEAYHLSLLLEPDVLQAIGEEIQRNLLVPSNQASSDMEVE